MPNETGEEDALTARDKLSVFIPLGIYLLYLLYLVFFNANPFLVRWLEGCFALFVALVFCNLLRKGLVDRAKESQNAAREASAEDNSPSRH